MQLGTPHWEPGACPWGPPTAGRAAQGTPCRQRGQRWAQAPGSHHVDVRRWANPESGERSHPKPGRVLGFAASGSQAETPFKRVTDSPNARREARRPQGRCEGSPRSGPHGLPEERWDLGGFGYDSATQRSARPPSSGLGAGAADRGPCRCWTDAQQEGRAWGHCTTQGRSQLGLPDGQLMRTAVSRGCFLRKHDLKGWFFYVGLPPVSMQRDVHQHSSPAGARGPPGALWALSSQPGPLPSGRDTVVADPHGGEDSRDAAGGCGAGPAVSPGPGSISGHPWQWAAWPPRPSSALPGQCSLHAPGTACGLGHPAQVPGGEMAL